MGLRSNIVRAIMYMIGPSRGYGIADGVRRKNLTAQLSRLTNNKVQNGPFKGMILPDITSWGDGDRAPKLLGTYEADLFPGLTERDRWLMVEEIRPEPMYWLVCRAHRPTAA